VAAIPVKIEAVLPYRIVRDGRFYMASCQVLDVHSQGKTKKAALENLIEASQLFIATCIEMGTLDQVLKDSGFRVSAKPLRKRASKEAPTISVPIPLWLLGARDAQNTSA
jgi:predicted RNase H-like HicB family nuclease